MINFSKIDDFSCCRKLIQIPQKCTRTNQRRIGSSIWNKYYDCHLSWYTSKTWRGYSESCWTPDSELQWLAPRIPLAQDSYATRLFLIEATVNSETSKRNIWRILRYVVFLLYRLFILNKFDSFNH